jgi:tetratricopeptide (TPR) repeat protein
MKLTRTVTAAEMQAAITEEDPWEKEMDAANAFIAEHPDSAEGYIKRARLHIEDGCDEAAMEEVDKALQLRSDAAEAHAIRGLLFIGYYFNDPEQAHREYAIAMALLARKHAVRLMPRDTDEKSPGELKAIIKQATKDIRNKKNAFAAQIRRARAYGELGESKKAERDIEKAILRDPTNAEGYLVRAELRDAEEDDVRMKADVKKAYSLDSTRPEGYTALANLYCHAGADLNDLALKAADKALSIRADFAPAHFVRGKILRNMDRLPEAIKEFRGTVTLDPTYAYGHLYLAECLEVTGQIHDAIVEYQHFIATADKVDVLEIIDVIKGIEELKKGNV